MNIQICDLCGSIYGLPHRVKLYEPVEGHLLAELAICPRCAKKLERHINNRKNRVLVHLRAKIDEFFKKEIKENK